MNFHHAAIINFRHQYQQLTCLLVFIAISLPLVVILLWVRPHTAVFFHVLLLTTGWLTWTFFEYMLHRFWMHKKDADSKRPMSERHQHHHLHPTEHRITPLQRVYMLLIVIACCMAGAYLHNYFTFVTGVCIGMAGYMFGHKFLHSKEAGKVFKRLFRYHIYHHCKYPDTCFGISTTLWDDLFGTVPPKTATVSPRVLAFYLNGPE